MNTRIHTTRAVELQRAEIISAAAMRRAMAEFVAGACPDAQGRSFAHPRAWATLVLVSGE